MNHRAGPDPLHRHGPSSREANGAHAVSPVRKGGAHGNQPLRVLHVYKSFLPESMGGVAAFIHHLASSLPAHGIFPTVLTLSEGGHVFKQTQQNSPEAVAAAPTGSGAEISEFHHEYPVFRVPRQLEIASTGIAWRFIRRLAELARHHDIVHYHFPWPYMDVAHLLAGIATPAIMTYHADIIGRALLHLPYRPIKDIFLRRMKRIVATSPTYARSSPTLRRHHPHVEVIPIGIAENLYPRPDPEATRRARLRYGDPFFLFVGAHRTYKGISVLLEAMRGTDLSIVLAGPSCRPADRESRIARRDRSRVYSLGPVTERDKVSLLRAARALVLPSNSRAEAFGVTLLEAAMVGTPLITCEIGTGTSWVNGPGCGLIVPPNDPHALRQAMLTLARDAGRAERCGSQAQARFRQHFTATTVAAAYARLYETIRA